MSFVRDSDEDMEGGGGDGERSRSRSPIGRIGNDDLGDIDLANLTPDSKKYARIVEAVVAAQIAPIKRNLNKMVDTTSQIKGTVDQNRRAVKDVITSTAQIEAQLKKSAKADPKSSLPGFVLPKLHNAVFESLKNGKKKEEMQTAVVKELIERSVITAADEEAVKAVSANEFSHFKSHMRGQISKDLSAGNTNEFPKAINYFKSHLKVQSVDESSHEYFTIMALGMAKFENLRQVPLTEIDKENKKLVDDHVENFWSWVQLKYQKHLDRGDTHAAKLKSILDNCGYQPKKNEGAIRRP